MTNLAERLSALFRPSTRRIAVKAIADASYKRGYAAGLADALASRKPVAA